MVAGSIYFRIMQHQQRQMCMGGHVSGIMLLNKMAGITGNHCYQPGVAVFVKIKNNTINHVTTEDCSTFGFYLWIEIRKQKVTFGSLQIGKYSFFRPDT